MPAAIAVLMTSTATVAETSRSRSMSGSRPFAGSVGSASFASARAAAMNSDGGIVAARQTITPRPRPGNISALFAWPMRYVVPSRSTGPNGLPVATRAAPSVQASRFSGVCSASTVGFDIGRMIGRSQCSCIERMTCSVKAPVTPGGADEHRRVEVVDDLLQAEGAVRVRASRRRAAGSLA